MTPGVGANMMQAHPTHQEWLGIGERGGTPKRASNRAPRLRDSAAARQLGW